MTYMNFPGVNYSRLFKILKKLFNPLKDEILKTRYVLSILVVQPTGIARVSPV